MPDDTTTITFNSDPLTDSSGQTTFLTGSVSVDYTTKSYSGNYRVQGGGTNDTGTLSNSGGLTSNNGQFTLTDGALTVTYNGEHPTSASSIVYNIAGTNVPGFGVVGGDTYSGTGGSLTSNPVCFVEGTRIRTTTGDIPIQDLAVGDLVITSSGEHRPIRWLGKRVSVFRHHPRPHEALPIRIAAHAFGENRPARDLGVSPGHSICVDMLGEVLIPAAVLVNGTTIVQETLERVTYWHVELDSHDIILAENLPAESYLEMGNRVFFEGGVMSLTASPDAPMTTHADFCRPFCADGRIVEAVRDRLAVIAKSIVDHLAKAAA